MRRREWLMGMAAALQAKAAALPANERVKWGLGANLWNYFPKGPFTDLLDVMRDTGFTGLRVTQFPLILENYGISAAQMEREVAKRNLHVVTISFSGPFAERAEHGKLRENARKAMEFLKGFGAKHLVVFSPRRVSESGTAAPAEAWKAMCDGIESVGELAGEMGFRAGLHNHLDQMVENQAELDLFMKTTDAKKVWLSPDTAHLHLAGCDVPSNLKKYSKRLILADYKDAKWTTPSADMVFENGRVLKKDSKAAKFHSSIYDLGDGEIDFKACHRVLKETQFNGWLIVDLDTARTGPRKSYERCGAYVVSQLEPIYK